MSASEGGASIKSLPAELLALIVEHLHQSSMDELIFALELEDARTLGAVGPLHAVTMVHQEMRILTQSQKLGITERPLRDKAGFQLERALRQCSMEPTAATSTAEEAKGSSDSQEGNDDWEDASDLTDDSKIERRVMPAHVKLGKLCVITSVWHLAQTCKTFRELCRPWQWMHLDFTSATNQDILAFISALAPSVSQYTRTLRMAMTRTMLTLKGVVADTEPDTFEPFRRMALAIVLFRFFDKITSLDTDLPLDRTSKDRFTDHLPDASNLLELELIDDCNELARQAGEALRPSLSMLRPVFDRYKHIKRLRLEDFDDTVCQPDGVHNIFDHVQSLESLTHLELINVRQARSPVLVPPSMTDWRPKLTHLTLYQFMPLDRTVLEALLKLCQETLEHLELDLIDGLEDLSGPQGLDDGPEFDFGKLEFLALGSADAGVQFIQRFRTSPLRSLEIGELEMAYNQFEPIIETRFFPQLEALWVLSGTGFSDAELESLEVLCLARGVDCQISEDDDDDDDGDGDDEDEEEDDQDDEDEDEDEDQDQDYMGYYGPFDDDDDGEDLNGYDAVDNDFDELSSNVIANMLARDTGARHPAAHYLRSWASLDGAGYDFT
ncbi:uncharacterized protein L969DRAFT_87061 [Mixia osmundae IAM 14324]|uniref:Uncharacterized protein n=1 Tax=Mixia osmundae (strain CBS 9802 / IAM 14324 / JCM 22182 / KY 12970) TaxID=764103 RepID=G7E6H3_MIXOS|nr:uncharacterized protein L969DRAFT_87061 [Mixia osmundae IAM 14324]KEI40410.1 hypothetical protein L969DRAFT_87061 [Mixia osmundae IAM 14324]GAA98433.1 hypothetical protein E5Q_05119 [Mixia osmundae IAM 14324]